jgi:hypothetical protein
VKLKRTYLHNARDAIEYHIKRGHGSWTAEEKKYFYENYMAKLEKVLPMGKRRGRQSDYTLKDRLSDTPKFLKKVSKK